MIEIIWKAGDRHHVMEIRGHAGYAEHGRDIVCAAVSAIAYALVGHLRNHTVLLEEPCIEPGELVIHARANGQTEPAFEMAFTGFMMISEQYPQFVDCKYIFSPQQAADTRN